VDRADLASDPRFDVRRNRNVHRHDLLPELAAVLERRTTREWLDELDARGVPCGPVNNVAEAVRSVQSVEYGAVKELVYRGERIAVLGTPLWFDENTAHPTASPPVLGEHTAQTLGEFLGYGPDRIAELVRVGAIQVSNPSEEGAR
jgi:crotonobetainyl-CoA:carnitine CoA-transferase CaiB-like acyl-CoA transferase